MCLTTLGRDMGQTMIGHFAFYFIPPYLVYFTLLDSCYILIVTFFAQMLLCFGNFFNFFIMCLLGTINLNMMD